MTYIGEILTGAFGERLQKLIRMRLAPGADKAAIDARIWDLFGEDWCIMFTDLSGFSRHVREYGIIHFLQTIFESHRIFTPVIDEHDGVLLKSEGDSLLILFRNPAKALAAAIDLQRATGQYNAGRDAIEQLHLCVGLGFGKCIRVGDEDIFGSEVNAACKLGEDVARGGEILVTEAVVEYLGSIPEGMSLEQVSEALPSGISRAYKLDYRL